MCQPLRWKRTFNHLIYAPCLHGEYSSGTVSTILPMNKQRHRDQLACLRSDSCREQRQSAYAWLTPEVQSQSLWSSVCWRGAISTLTYFSFLCKLPDVTSLSWDESWVRTHHLSASWWIQAVSQPSFAVLSHMGPPSVSYEPGSSGSAEKNSVCPPPPISLPGEAGVGWAEISGLKSSSFSPPQKEERDTY